MKNNNNGITLIALVITIIILIILAGVVINLSLGENGLFNKTKEAKNQYINAQIGEEEGINKISEQLSKEDKLITEIVLDKTSITMVQGDTENLTVTILPENATNKKVTWTSSDTSVATVENGIVTAIAAGTATITATAADGSGKSASCEIVVENIEEVYEFNYLNEIQTFSVPITGNYAVEAYGSRGNGGANGTKIAGTIALQKGEELKLYVGGTNGYSGNIKTGGNGVSTSLYVSCPRCGKQLKSTNVTSTNGGGATIIKYNDEDIAIAGGGAGKSISINEPVWCRDLNGGEHMIAPGGLSSTTSNITKTTSSSNSKKYYGTNGSTAQSRTIEVTPSNTEWDWTTGYNTLIAYGGGGGGYYGGKAGYTGTSYINSTLFTETTTTANARNTNGKVTLRLVSH